MNFKNIRFEKTDEIIRKWMAGKGLLVLRVSIGIIFLWFGFLKYFEGLSPAEDIAIRSISTISFGLIPDKVIIYGLATWEVLIGLGFIFNIFMRATLILLFLQMAGTFAPLFLFPSEVFKIFPYALTLEGQYIIKNIVIIAGAIVLGGHISGDKISRKE